MKLRIITQYLFIVACCISVQSCGFRVATNGESIAIARSNTSNAFPGKNRGKNELFNQSNNFNQLTLIMANTYGFSPTTTISNPSWFLSSTFNPYRAKLIPATKDQPIFGNVQFKSLKPTTSGLIAYLGIERFNEKSPKHKNSLNENFGKNVSIESTLLVKTGNTSLYCPHIIEINNLSIDNYFEKTRAIGLKKDDFTLHWNADSLNKNGVMLLMTLSADLTIEQTPNTKKKDKNKEIQKTFYFPDTGSLTLPVDSLTDFPANARVMVYLSRSNSTVLKYTSNYSNKFECRSQHKFDAILTE